MSTPSAEILTIGTELLLGEILDTNAREISLALRDIGLDLFRITTVGDNRERIASAIRTGCERAQVLICTGGLGPTVDDVTREGVAEAFNLSTEFYPELWDQIKERFARFGRIPTENNRSQARLPFGAVPIENPVGTAPGFILEAEGCVVIALPGVPTEMRYLLEKSVIPYLHEHLELKTLIKTRILRTAGQGESWLDQRIQDLEQSENPTLGLSAHPGKVDLRITVKANDENSAMNMIQSFETDLRDRIGEFIYGADQDTLEGVTLAILADRGWNLATIECGTNGLLSGSLSRYSASFAGGWILPQITETAELSKQLYLAMRSLHASAGLAVAIQRGEGRLALWLHLATPIGCQSSERSYGGAPQNAPAWAESFALDFLRQYLLENP